MNDNNQNQNQGDNQNQGGKKDAPRFNFSWLYMFLIGGLIFMIMTRSDGGASKEIGYVKFKECVEKNYVSKITVDKDKGSLTMVPNTLGEKHIFGNVLKDSKTNPRAVKVEFGSMENLENFLDKEREAGNFTGDVQYEQQDGLFVTLLWNIGPLILIIVVWVFIMRRMSGGGMGGGIFSVGKSKAKLFEKDDKTVARVTFKDVAGQQGAKQEVLEIVDFLKTPQKYTTLGGKIPKGALLVGPPGTGKTLLAKAVAGEANVPFFSMSGSDFVEMFVGVGASRVRDLFQQAKAKAPCIIFIDEIDAIGRARSKSVNMGGNDERENTLNQLLTEMDGFGTNSGVIILAATNRADILDKALLRPGRFDRQITVDLPDVHGRKEIFNVHLRNVKIDESVDVEFLSRQTPGFSGADIANVCNEAALIAARKEKKKVEKQDFLAAVDRIIGGLERKNSIMTKAEKVSTAIHEAGHATVSWMLQYANPLIKVTIVPRGVALGAAWYLPEERQLTNKEHIMDNLCSLLGGRAAEEVFLQQTSTGALNDLERATKQAYAMVAYYGMSDKLKNLSYYDSTGRYDMGITKPYSEKTAEVIDSETSAIIAEQMARAKKILQENAEGHNKLAEMLIEKEVITSDDVASVLGPRPWASRTDEIIEANEAMRLKGEEEKPKKKRAPRKKKAEEVADLPSTSETIQ